MNVRIPEDSIISLCKRLTELAGGQVNVREGYTAYESGVSMFYSRYVITARDDHNAPDIVRRITAYLKAGGPRLLSYTEEFCGKGFAGELLQNGFKNIINQVGMYLCLSVHTLSGQNNPNIVRISDDDLEEWSRVCELGFGKPSELPALRYWIHDRECSFYAYKIDGKIVATALAHNKRGHCGIHEVATLQDYRGKGICTSLITRVIDDAKNNGARMVSLQASEAGAPVYERLGMKKSSIIHSWINLNH